MFSPDSTLVATGSFDGGVGLYDLSHKKPLDSLTARGAIVSLAVANHNIVAVGTITHLAQVFDASTGQEVARFNRNDIRAVALDTEGELLATATGSLVEVTKIARKKTASKKDVFSFSHKGPVSMIAFSPREHLLASASSDGTVQLHKTPSGQPYGQPLHHGAPVDVIAFSEDGRVLGTADKNGVVRIYEVSKKCKLITSLPAQGTVMSIGFASNNAIVILARTDQTVRMYESLSGREVARLIHDGRIVNIAVSNHTTPMVASAGGKIATVVEVTRGQHVSPLSVQQNVDHAAFDSSGKVAVSDQATVALFKVSDGQQLQGGPKPSYSVTNLSYSSDGRFLAMIKQNQTTQLVDLFDGTSIRQLPNLTDVVAASFSRDNAIVAIAGNSTKSAGQDQTSVWMFDPLTGKELPGRPTYAGQARSVALSPDHELLGLGTSRGAYVIPLEKDQERRLLYPEAITAINFSRDGSRVALGTATGAVYVLDPVDGRRLYGPANAEGTITDVQFGEDNNIVAALSNEGILHVFDIGANAEIGRFPRATVKAFTFGDGTLITLSVDEEGPFLQTHKLGTRELIEEACSLLARNLSPEKVEPLCRHK